MKLKITIEGRAYEVEVDVLEELAPDAPAPVAPVPAPAPAARTAASAPPPAPASAPAPAAAPSSGGNGMPSPLAGIVRSIKVQPGQAVTANEEVLILEAMKMETSVYASSAGTVKAVLVNEGDNVQSGQPLLEFE